MPRRSCLTTVRFAMVCDILAPTGSPNVEGGEWHWVQNEESGALEQVWRDNYETMDVVEGVSYRDIPLFAEGILDGGIRVAGTTERFGKEYENVDFVKAVFGPKAPISKRSKVTNIRMGRTGEVLWKEEEMSFAPPTTFDVMGVTPVLFLSKLVEKSVLLSRSEVQDG